MVVKDKRADIAILRTLGAAPRDMMRVFMTQGSVIGIVGTLAGLALGLAARGQHQPIVAFIQQRHWA